MTKKISEFLLVSFLLACPLLGQTDAALAAYKEANYKVAIPLLKAAVGADPKNALLHAALLSSLTYEGKVDEASDEAEEDESAFPQSVEVMAARGEFSYYMADMLEAERLFRAALKMNPDWPRAVLGMGRLLHAASYFRKARILFMRAHELDAGDALITKYWLGTVPEEKRGDLMKPFAAAHPWLYRNFEMRMETKKQLDEALHKRKQFEIDGTPAEATLHLMDLLRGPRNVVGMGLEMRINGGKKITLLLDTGASGILLPEKVIDKAGLAHVGEIEGYGVGDDGGRKGFLAIAETCEVGPVKFKACVFHALGGKHLPTDDVSGLIGADTFDDYLIMIDFQKRSMELKPFAARAKTPQGYDREVAAEEKDFTAMFRNGDHLFVTTKMNGEDSGLFLLDSGAQLSSVDAAFASQSVKLHRDQSMRVKGISGEVKKVFEVDKAELEFAGFRQKNLGMTVFDLNNGPDSPEFRMSGILGFPVMTMFHLSLDYRNGLVKFERALK